MSPWNTWGRFLVQSMLVRLRIFSNTLRSQRTTWIFNCSDCAMKNKYEKWKNIMKNTDSVPQVLHSFDRHIHRENISQHFKLQDIQYSSPHFPAMTHKKTGICQGLTVHSLQSHMIFLRIHWTCFACEEQSFFLFSELISIKSCRWLGTSCTFAENQHTVDTVERKGMFNSTWPKRNYFYPHPLLFS